MIVYGDCVSELGPTLEDLHAEIGRTLVIWGWLEGEMIDARINWRHVSPEAATDPLKTFLLDLVEPRGIRNVIAHGLASAHSNPWEADFEPYVTCRNPDVGVRKITLSICVERNRSFRASGKCCGGSRHRCSRNLQDDNQAAMRPIADVPEKRKNPSSGHSSGLAKTLR